MSTFPRPSYSLRNRLARMLWNFVQASLFRFSPRPFHSWRNFLLRLFGAKVGYGAHIYPKVNIWAPWNLEIGDETGVGDGATLYSQGRISIGNRAVISQGAHLCAGTHDYENENFSLVTKPIVICSYAWVAAEVFVHPGVEIGEGAVVGARSVVTKSLSAWTVSAGNPCKTIKLREWRPKF